MIGTPQWSILCRGCGQSRGLYPQHDRPGVAMWECDCGASLDLSEWVSSEPIWCPRLSGFSTSESDFTPHLNRAFGRRVSSLEQMRSLQRAAGTSDVVVKGDGAEEHAPRDIGSRIRRHKDTREALASGQTVFEPKLDDGRPSGVRIDLSAQTEAD